MPAKRSKSHSKPSPAGRTARATAGSAPQDQRLGQLQRLIELMVEKDVVEVELEDGGTRWRVRRTDPAAVTYATAPGLAMAPMAMPMAGGMGLGHAMGHGHAPASGASSHGGGTAEPQGEVFKSPMLGTFYRAASPEAEPFVKAGDRVSADRTLCIIEAMKVMNEIKAEREFEIVEVLVKNGEPVEYGQPLFVIR